MPGITGSFGHSRSEPDRQPGWSARKQLEAQLIFEFTDLLTQGRLANFQGILRPSQV